MSQYGRLWQQVSDIRAELRNLLPGEFEGDFTPFYAREKVKAFANKLLHLVARWEALEEEMKRTDD